jgi:sec-independent protein translocase protein TatA
MLGLDNPLHIAFILVLLLLVFGAKRLPELGRSLGSGLRGFKESISGDDTAAELTATHSPVRVDDMPPKAPVAAEPVAARAADPAPIHPAA